MRGSVRAVFIAASLAAVLLGQVNLQDDEVIPLVQLSSEAG